MTDDNLTLPPAPGPDATTLALPAGSGNLLTCALETPGAVAAPSSEATIAGFEIIRELGRGGMGVVYLARQTRLNRPVALKMILSGSHASAPERQRFLAEAEAVAAVQHPGIVQVYEFGTSGEQPFFALEYCSGGSLAHKLAGTPLPPKEAAAPVARIAMPIQALHDLGIVHRDLKPDNVLFSADGNPKVTDFGLARRVEIESGLTKTGAIMGTPSYMAPEQASGGSREVGPAADVWALGAVLYECLTGRPPFRAATALDTILQVVSDEPVAPRSLHPTLPRDLDTICLKCLQKDPLKRYSSAAALADDLDRFLAGDPIKARPISVVERTWRAIQKRPTTAALVALVVLSPAVIGLGLAGITTAHNRALKVERDRAEQDREAADHARVEMEAQKATAQDRLEKAIEVVERMHNRISGAKMGRAEPALAAERRQILEEVVAFYEGFNTSDANNPLVQRETARAYRRIGGVYVLLAEHDKADRYLNRARAICQQLADAYPSEPKYLADLTDTLLHVAQEASSSGRASDAHAAHRDAVAAGRRALAGMPGNVEVRRSLVSCLIGLGFYTMTIDRTAAAALFREAVGHVDELMAEPEGTFPTRALAAFTYAGAATFEYGSGHFAVGKAREEQAAKILAETTIDPAAPAHYRDLFDMTRGVLKLSAASAMISKGQLKDAAAVLQEAATIFNSLLAVYPRAFQYQVYKLLVLAQQYNVLSNLKRTDEAKRCKQELFALEKTILTAAPKLMYIRSVTAILRTMELVQHAEKGDVEELDATATDMLAVATDNPNSGNIRYNVACALSQGSRFGTASQREQRAAKAVQILTELLGGPFFKGITNAAHVDRDSDLNPIRARDDFKAFRARMPN